MQCRYNVVSKDDSTMYKSLKMESPSKLVDDLKVE